MKLYQIDISKIADLPQDLLEEIMSRRIFIVGDAPDWAADPLPDLIRKYGGTITPIAEVMEIKPLNFN